MVELNSNLSHLARCCDLGHPHMLRHSTGYNLANDDHVTRSLAHYLGHRNLESTARYTALARDRFAKFWRTKTRRPIPLWRQVGIPRWQQVRGFFFGFYRDQLARWGAH